MLPVAIVVVASLIAAEVYSGHVTDGDVMKEVLSEIQSLKSKVASLEDKLSQFESENTQLKQQLERNVRQ